MLDSAIPLAALPPHSPGPYVALVLAGFAIGILGHLTRTRWLVASGVILIFLGALLLPLGAAVAREDRAAPMAKPGGQAG